jgi:AcrR family transcriptional regulator
MDQKFGPQYERTHKAICSALVELLKDKPFEKITVQNILDVTPVTRTTFYKHFRDKYEIAEYMQQQCIEGLERLRRELGGVDILDYQKVIARYGRHNVEQVRALLKINTERVNLREIVSAAFKSGFCRNNGFSPESIEANVYADALASFMVNSIDTDMEQMDSRRFYNKVMITVVLALLSLDEDEEVRRLLLDKVNHVR